MLLPGPGEKMPLRVHPDVVNHFLSSCFKSPECGLSLGLCIVIGEKDIFPLLKRVFPPQQLLFGDLCKLFPGQGSKILMQGYSDMLLQMVACVADITDEAGVQKHKKPVCEHM